MIGPLPGEPVRPAKSGWLARRVSMAVRWDEALRLGRGGAETMPPLPDAVISQPPMIFKESDLGPPERGKA